MKRSTDILRFFRSALTVARLTLSRSRHYGVRSGCHALSTPIRNLWLRALNRVCPPKVECPCCGWRGYAFRYLDIGQWVLPQIECPQCRHHDRHRLLRLVLHRFGAEIPWKGGSVLHCAPEPMVRQWLKEQGAALVVNTDLCPAHMARGEDPALAADLCRLPLQPDAFDAVVNIHVLEHIPEDRAALAEIRRVLRPGGVCVLMVPFAPIPETVEFGKPNPELFDHVRDYSGSDFAERLDGFEVAAYRAGGILTTAERDRYQIQPGETVYCCRKPRA